MSLITNIEAWACQIADRQSPLDPAVRALIREWSRFLPKGGGAKIDMGQKTLDQLSPGWVQSIYWRAEKAIRAHQRAQGGTLSLFGRDVAREPTSPKKRAVRARRRPSGEVWVADVDESKRMPNDGEWNHDPTIPF